VVLVLQHARMSKGITSCIIISSVVTLKFIVCVTVATATPVDLSLVLPYMQSVYSRDTLGNSSSTAPCLCTRRQQMTILYRSRVLSTHHTHSNVDAISIKTKNHWVSLEIGLRPVCTVSVCF
jgi:hypothetical protein